MAIFEPSERPFVDVAEDDPDCSILCQKHVTQISRDRAIKALNLSPKDPEQIEI
jgi:hypothetical protein